MAHYTINLLPAKEDISFTPAEWQVVRTYFELKDFDKLINRLRMQHNMDTKAIESTLLGLQKKGIIKLTQTQVAAAPTSEEIPAKFWETINIELSKSIGPIASIVIDNNLEEFNYPQKTFPKKLLFSFIEKVANQIGSPEEKSQFQKTMLNFIKQNI